MKTKKNDIGDYTLVLANAASSANYIVTVDRIIANMGLKSRRVRVYIIFLLAMTMIILASLAVMASPVTDAFQACEGDRKTALVAGGISGCVFGMVGGVAGCTVGAVGFTAVAKEGFSLERCMDSKL